MRILVVSAIFPPEPVVSARTSAQIAEELTREGHEVVVITAFPSRPSGVQYPGYSRKLVNIKLSLDGYKTIRCFTFFSPRSTLLSRLIENLSFGIAGGIALLLVKKPDAIYINSWPIISVGIFHLISRLRRVPDVISIQDLYPESLRAQERISEHGLIYRLFMWMDGLIARSAEGVVVISERFAEAYRKLRRVDERKVHVIPNWASVDEIQLDVKADEYRHRLGIPRDAFVCVYGGNIGVASGIDTLLDSFKQPGKKNGIYLIIAGEGSRLAFCQQVANALPGKQVIIHSPWHEYETSLVLRSADLLVLPTRNEQSLSSIPSKLIYYMLSARPILALVHPESDTAKVISRAKCGWTILPDHPEEIMEKITWIKNNFGDDLEQIGQSGREYAIKHYSKETCLPKITTLIGELEKSSIE